MLKAITRKFRKKVVIFALLFTFTAGCTISVNSNNNTAPNSGNQDVVAQTPQTNVSQSPSPSESSMSSSDEDYFYFKDDQGSPTTFLKSTDGDDIAFIRWDSQYFEPSGYTPEVRGNIVTKRLNEYFNEDPDLEITHGIASKTGIADNNNKIICVAKNDSCTNLLYTLQPYRNGEKAVDILVNKLGNPTTTPEIVEAGCKTFISVQAIRRKEKQITRQVCF